MQEQLAAHRRETLSRDMDYWKKSSSSNNKSKNILKKGFKKLKGKIQVCGVEDSQWYTGSRGRNTC